MPVRNPMIVFCLFALGMLAADPAYAFRCKSKLVKDGMHEQQVIAICGQPTTRRDLGYAVRSLSFGWQRVPSGGFHRSYYPAYSHLQQEVIVTEYVYNFGPRKLMRRLIFEGGVLVNIETIGYGYIEKQPR